MAFTDPTGLFDLPSFLGGWANYEVQKAASSLSNSTPQPNPTYDLLDKVVDEIVPKPVELTNKQTGTAVMIVSGLAVFGGGGIPALWVMAAGAILYTTPDSDEESQARTLAKTIANIATPPEVDMANILNDYADTQSEKKVANDSDNKKNK